MLAIKLNFKILNFIFVGGYLIARSNDLKSLCHTMTYEGIV